MLRVPGCQRNAIRQLEICKVKTRRHGTTDQRILTAAGKVRSKPAAAANDCEKRSFIPGIARQPVRDQPATVRDLMDQQWVSGIKVPELVRGDSMERGEFPIGKQEINMRGCGAIPLKK